MSYRKLFEPAYGEVAPYVNIGPPEIMDGAHLKQWRVMHNHEVAAEMNRLMRACNCYGALMEIETDDVKLARPDGEDITMRLYHPPGDGPHRVLVFYHGGGWSMNNLEIYDYVPRYFARFGGVFVVSVDYRLAPEYKFPTGLEDCYAATEWTWENAAKYGGDRRSFSIAGDSAGGNFAAAIALMARDRKGPQISKQILIYPCTTFNLTERPQSELRYGNGGYFLEIDSSRVDGMPHYLANPQDRLSTYASPMEETDFTGVAPACFISAECDPLLDQALMYAAKLQDNGIEIEFNLHEGMLHAFLNQTYQKTFEAFDQIVAACPTL